LRRSVTIEFLKEKAMLKGVNPLLHADLLATLCAMGHGDDLVIADANFPSESVARHTTLGKVLRLDGADVPQAVRAILSVFPLDSFVDAPVQRMEVVGNATELPVIQQEVQAAIDQAEGRNWPMGSVERMAFYEQAKKSYAVIATSERRFYGCFILKKGVIAPEA
jgi:L-fucose mutarotase